MKTASDVEIKKLLDDMNRWMLDDLMASTGDVSKVEYHYSRLATLRKLRGLLFPMLNSKG